MKKISWLNKPSTKILFRYCIIAIIFLPMFLPFILFLFTKDEKEEFQCKLLEEKRREDRWKI